jgi:hypothetical protein
MSSASDAADDIRKVVRRELADCASAIENKEYDEAQGLLDDAVRKLKRIANDLD